MATDTPEHIVDVLKDNLQTLGCEGTNDLLVIEKAIGVCSCALMELRECVNQQDFKTQEEEIYFFKVTKPYVLEEYLYYSKLFEIETRRPVTTTRAQKRFLKKMISQAQQFFNENPEFYQYYRGGSEHLDDRYFVRTEISCFLNCHHFIFDPCFSTSHDYTLAAIKANEKIIICCKAEINQLDVFKNSVALLRNLRQKKINLSWTGSKTALIEMIYAVHSTGTVNHGTADIKELVEGFEILLLV
jgi:hypothetical protein